MFLQAAFFMAVMEKLLCNPKALSASVPFSVKKETRNRPLSPCLFL